MNTFAAVLLATVVCGQLVFAGWETEVVPKLAGVDGDRYVMIYQSDADRGTNSLVDSIERLSSAGHLSALSTLTIHQLVEDATFQREVFEQMERIAPEALKAARRSAGNMHNPRMTALHGCFSQAVMATPTVTALNQALGKHRMKIVRPSFEKLELHRKDQTEIFWCFLWLTVEPESSPTTEKP
ncbi:MAG TPA: hypothetical protein PK529_05380 [Verrucomicrobiales bacterium]|nr:hypothetical protein [Verrucomicrobiales bacterium]